MDPIAVLYENEPWMTPLFASLEHARFARWLALRAAAREGELAVFR